MSDNVRQQETRMGREAKNKRIGETVARSNERRSYPSRRPLIDYVFLPWPHI